MYKFFSRKDQNKNQQIKEAIAKDVAQHAEDYFENHHGELINQIMQADFSKKEAEEILEEVRQKTINKQVKDYYAKVEEAEKQQHDYRGPINQN